MGKLRINLVVLVVGVVVFLGAVRNPVLALGAKTFCDDGDNAVEDPVIDNVRIYTALGCVPAEMDKFVGWLLPILFGISGGIAFLLMVYGFIMMGMSGGDPKKVAGAQETVSSAITGLLLSIFALFILRLIAVDILQIPGF